MYEPFTVEVDRAYGDGTYRSHSIDFTGRVVQLIEKVCDAKRHKGGPKTEGSRDKMMLPLTRAQLDFASVMVDAYARGTKFWFQFWGPLGNPAIETVDAAAEAQQDYLRKLKETLEEIEAQSSTSSR